MTPPIVFLDADVIFAGAAAPTEHSASHLVLRLGEITLLNCFTSQQVNEEVQRNMNKKLPEKLPELQLLMSRCLRLVNDPTPGEVRKFQGQAHWKDLPILTAALLNLCPVLLTFNLRHFTPNPNQILVQTPGEFITSIRNLLAHLPANIPRKPSEG